MFILEWQRFSNIDKKNIYVFEFDVQMTVYPDIFL